MLKPKFIVVQLKMFWQDSAIRFNLFQSIEKFNIYWIVVDWDQSDNSWNGSGTVTFANYWHKP